MTDYSGVVAVGKEVLDGDPIDPDALKALKRDIQLLNVARHEAGFANGPRNLPQPDARKKRRRQQRESRRGNR